jgi:hypothetical protein
MNISGTRVLPKFIALAMLASVSSVATAVTITKVRTDDLSQGLNSVTSAYESPFFTSALDGAPVNPSGGWAPTTLVQAATASATSSSPRKTYNIVGNSTSAGADLTPGTSDDWLDGNGIPAGITLAFDAQFTVTALPTGSMLTHPGTSIGVATPAQFGRGIGIQGVVGGPNDFNAGQGIEVSAVAVSNVTFSGSPAEANFTFSPGNVANFGTVLFRSNFFDEESDGAILTNQEGGTIGFGLDSGTIAGSLAINNNFGGGTSPSSFFPRQPSYTLIATTEGLVLKGMTLEYDVTYDISPATGGAENADFDSDGDVDGEDFLTWQQNVGTSSGGTREQGNANPGTDGAVDGADLAIWSSQFGTSPSSAVAGVVPEPSALAIGLGSVVGFGAFRGRRRKA